MGWLEVAGGLIKIILWILGAVKDTNDEKKKKKAEIISDATKAIINRDAAAYTIVLDRIRGLR